MSEMCLICNLPIFQCERCGGTGQQIAGLWDSKDQAYTSKAGKCVDCDGEGKLLHNEFYHKLIKMPPLLYIHGGDDDWDGDDN